MCYRARMGFVNFTLNSRQSLCIKHFTGISDLINLFAMVSKNFKRLMISVKLILCLMSVATNA